MNHGDEKKNKSIELLKLKKSNPKIFEHLTQQSKRVVIKKKKKNKSLNNF